ncbi:MAG: RDD family protein [Novosphingobium sp.]|uniref:RDD family protein n=1 Tax=Novosphingobium sp. TaxID=1874826 RepID=UPI0032BA2EDA
MPVYGGFWIRVAAYLIDTILLMVAGGVIGGILGASVGMANANDPEGFRNGILGIQMVSLFANLTIGWLYFALMESSANRATVGKIAVGLVVTDLDGGQIGFGRATGRYFAKILSSLILLIGFIMVGLTERKQGLHDMLAGTLVTKKGSLTGPDTAGVFS